MYNQKLVVLCCNKSSAITRQNQKNQWRYLLENVFMFALKIVAVSI